MAPTTYRPTAMTPSTEVGRLHPWLASRHAQWLTHAPLILITVAYFAALIALPFWLAFFPCVVLAHRIGTLLHEYIHGIPFTRYRDNHAVVTLYDGIMLMFGTFEMFRVSHLEHHRWLNTTEDGAAATEKKVGRTRWLDFVAGMSLIQYLIGFYHALLGRRKGVRRDRMFAAAVISLACIAAWISVGLGIVVWKMLAVTVFTMAVPVSLRSAIEHHSYPGDSSFANEYRVWIPLFNLNRHIHHHEDPSIPWFRLRWRTSTPLPRWHYVGHWFRVYVKRQFVLMRPMRSSDVRRESRRGVGTVVALLLLLGCGQRYSEPHLLSVAGAPAQAAARDTLKVHMRSGELYILSRWRLGEAKDTLFGSGSRYDVWRATTPVDSARIPTADIALLEASTPRTAVTFGTLGMGVMTVLGGYVSAVCLLDPKSCFGSCPTFYVEGADTSRVHAEGFSSSVARILEARDVDALDVTPSGRRLAIRMRNEALETHMVRRVTLLAAPRRPGERVFASGDSVFYRASNLTEPSRCTAPEGDCRGLLSRRDGKERLSSADSNDLATRETIHLTFEDARRRPGIIITARNSLVSTFLFYQTLAYLGRGAGSALAALENGTREEAESRFGMAQLLGGIEVQVRRGPEWVTAGTYQEHGPIASDTKLIPLPPADGEEPIEVRLVAARGNWRVDQVALVEIGQIVPVARIEASRVERFGRRDANAARSLRDSSLHLVTLPGDEYRLVFDLPQGGEQELFLDTEGYYYEWIRGEWMAEENPLLANAVIQNPAWGLRHLAGPYKAREAGMEKLFWASRFNVRRSNADNR